MILIASANPSIAWWAALNATVGSTIGALILFQIARKGGRVFLAKYEASPRGARIRAWFERYGLLTVFIPSVSPIPMPVKIPVFCAGALGVRTTSFLAVTVAARAIRYFSYAYLVQRYGSQTLPFLKSHASLVVAIIVVLALLSLGLLRVLDREPQPA